MKKNNLQLLILSSVAVAGIALFVSLFVGNGFATVTDNAGNTYSVPNVTR